MKLKLLSIALLIVNINQAQNLIQNPGFEQFSSNTPSQWSILYGQTQPENNIFIEGTKSVKLITTAPNVNIVPLAWLTQNFTLNDTDEYTLKFKYYIPGTILTNTIERVGVGLSLVQEPNAFFFPQIPARPIIFESWQTVSFPFKILLFRNGATSVDVSLSLTVGSPLENQIVYFDDVQIVKSPNLNTNDFDFNNKSVIKNITSNDIEITKNTATYSYKIFSIDGKLIKEDNNVSSEFIPIENLSNGMYIMNLNLNGKISKLKFMKN